MKVYRGKGLGDFYYEIIRDITEHGRKVNIRGNDCLELPERVCLEYTSLGHCWMRIPQRKFNPFLALAEVLWILSGRGDAEWIIYYGSNLKSFLDEGATEFHGAYGTRIRKWPEKMCIEDEVMYDETDQINEVVKKLRAQPTSRQAVISLWDPNRDNEPSKDIPCNNLIYYELRGGLYPDGVLNQTVVIRSNDIVWGTPYNAVQFSHIHAYVAGLLGVKIGTLTYVIQNLHYYLDLYKPTLTNLIEHAYNHDEPIVAEAIPGFGTFSDWELLLLKKDVEISRTEHDVRTGIEIPQRPIWSSYTKQIADMLRLFIKVKSGFNLTTYSFEYLSGLEQPLRDLVIDFYEDSSMPAARKVVEFLRRNNDVCA